MANRKNTFLIKRSNVAGKIPAAGDLQLGELALNTADNILYASGTTANSILPIGWDRVARTGDTVTGNFNFFGDVKISGSSLPNGYALSVTGDTNFIGDVYVTGDLTYNGSLLVTGGTVIQSGLTANTIYTDYIDFNTNYTGATLPAGRLQWDDGNGTLVLGLKGGVSNIELGLENMALCYNSEATTLTAGTVVYVSGSQGNRPSIKRAIATGDGYSVTTLGVVSESIASGAEGFVTTFGMVNNLNTVGYSGGTPIWLSPTDAGGYTTVKPQAPNHTVLIGYIVRVHASVGSVFVHVSNGWEIDELHDVRINNKTQGDLLTLSAYNGSDVWVNSKTLNGSYTMTGLTVQGNSSSDLVRITQTGTGNAFVVEDTTNPDATQFVIDTTGKVGIGLTNPEYILDIVSSGGTTSFENISRFRTIDSTDYLSITNAVSTDGSFNPILRSFNNTNISPNFYIQSVISPSVDTGINPLLVIQGRVSTDPGNVPWSGITTRPILRVSNNNSSLVEVTYNGNFGIGTTTPTEKLDVRGNALVSSGLTATTVSATTYQNLPTDIRVTGGTYSNNTFTYTNNTGGTFDVLFNTVTGLTVNGNVTITGNTNISGSSTTVGDVCGFSLVSTQSIGDEGGEVRLSTAQTNTSLSGGSITFDVYQNKLRFFESGGSNRGVYIDLTAAGAGVSTNLLSGGGGEINTASNLGAGTGIFAQKVAADLQFKSLTSTGGTVTISNDANTVNVEVVPASSFTGGTVTGTTIFTNGLSANTISATTYQNLPISTDTFVTGATYSNNTFTYTNNTGGTFNVLFNTVTGLTSTGTIQTSTLSATTISANTVTTFIPAFTPQEIFRGVTFSNNSTTVTTFGGVTMSTTASNLAISVSSTDFASKQIRLRYYSTTVSGGRYTGTRGSALLWYIHGGFRYVCDFRISDTSFASDCQQFYGLAGSTADLAYGGVGLTQVSTLTNLIGVGNDGVDTNLQIIHNDASGTATKIDLGSGFPANRTVGAATTTMYSVTLYNAPASNSVKYMVVNNETGAVAMGEITTNLPAITQGLNFFASRAMGGGGGVTGSGQFELSKLGVYSLL